MDVEQAMKDADNMGTGADDHAAIAERVWAGTRWHYPQIERMADLVRTLAAEVRRLAGADKPKPPRRAAEIDVRVGANNWDDAVRELKWTVEHVEDHGPSCQSVSGGPSGNHIVTVYQDPTMTHERYFEELDKYLAAAEAAREGRGT